MRFSKLGVDEKGYANPGSVSGMKLRPSPLLRYMNLVPVAPWGPSASVTARGAGNATAADDAAKLRFDARLRSAREARAEICRPDAGARRAERPAAGKPRRPGRMSKRPKFTRAPEPD